LIFSDSIISLISPQISTVPRKTKSVPKRSLILNENQRAKRKLAAGCSKHGFEVVDRADVVWRDFRRVL